MCMNENSNTILFYTKEMMREVEESLTSTGYVLRGKNNGWRKNVDTGESFLKIKKDDITLEICVFNHGYSPKTQAFPPTVEFYESIEVWYINASLGHIQPKDLGNIVNKLYHFWNEYRGQDGFNELKDYVAKHNSKLDDVDICESEIAIYEFADQYINEKGIKDDKLHIPYCVIEAALNKIIRPILYENDRVGEEDDSDDYFNI